MRPDRQICQHDKRASTVFVVIDGHEHELCDDCSRRLRTCNRCSAFEPGEAQDREGRCVARAVSLIKNPWSRCRDQWRQARPWTREEALAQLGEDDAAEPSGDLG